MSEGLQVRALIFDRQASALSQEEALYSYLHGSDILWVDVVARDHDAAKELLEEHFAFHPLLAEDALSPHERPTLSTEEDDLIFFVAPAVRRENDCEAYVEVAFFIRPNALVTVSTESVDSIDKYYASSLKRNHSRHDNIIDIAHSLLDLMVDDFYPVIDAINEEIDEMEESIYSGKRVEIADTLGLKRRLLEMRRRIGPLRDILNGMLRREAAIIPPESFPYFQDIFDHALRIIEVIDMERDILSAVMDAHLSMQSNQLNRVMQNMTIISTLLMTAALVAGVYGMNFKFMPELDWRFGYPFAVATMAAFCGLEIYFFKKKGWM